jgi:hypothetical protein
LVSGVYSIRFSLGEVFVMQELLPRLYSVMVQLSPLGPHLPFWAKMRPTHYEALALFGEVHKLKRNSYIGIDGYSLTLTRAQSIRLRSRVRNGVTASYISIVDSYIQNELFKV